MPGYIYMIMMADGVYKVGRTQQDHGTYLKRLKSYPPDSQIVYIRRVQGDVMIIEAEIIEIFRNEFGKHPRGNEYFKGDENRMIEIIHELVSIPPQTRMDNHPLKRFIQSRFILDPSEAFPLQVLIRIYDMWCKQNQIARTRFNENFYKGIFSQYDIEVRLDSRVWAEEAYSTQPFVFGLKFKIND